MCVNVLNFLGLIENNLLFNFNKTFIGLIISDNMSDEEFKKIFAEHTKKRKSKAASMDNSIDSNEYTITKNSDFMNKLRSAFKKSSINVLDDVIRKIISIGKLDSGESYTSVNYVVREMLKSNPVRSELRKFAVRKYFLGKDNPKTDYDLEFRIRGIIYTLENDEPVFMINLKDSTRTKEPFWELSYKGGIKQDVGITSIFQQSETYDFSIFNTAARECKEEFSGSMSKALFANHKAGRAAYANLVEEEQNNSDIMYFTRKANKISPKKETMILAMYANILLPIDKRVQSNKFNYTEHLDTKWVKYDELLCYLEKSRQQGMKKDLIFAKNFIPFYNFKRKINDLSDENILINNVYRRLDTYKDSKILVQGICN